MAEIAAIFSPLRFGTLTLPQRALRAGTNGQSDLADSSGKRLQSLREAPVGAFRKPMKSAELPARILIDIDGVCYLRGTRIDGAAEAVTRLCSEGRSVVYVTNNSWGLPSTYAETLRALGFPAGHDQVVTSSMAAASLLLEGDPASRRPGLARGALVGAMGGPGLVSALDDAGFEPSGVDELDGVPADDVGAVVVGVDRDLSYARVSQAARLVRGGSWFLATNTDATFPTESGLLPGAGSIVGAVSIASGVDPTVAGKPEAGLAKAAASVVGVGPGLVIGDRIETDMAFARRNGHLAGLVLTGVSAVEDLASAEYLPDLVANDMAELVESPVRIELDDHGAPVAVSGGESLRRAIGEALGARCQ
ncbi:MAG: hypothetical protein DCC49_12150 [Acidobacteria bacterium]|nr:MAG: hypothetical protein DCC49_12150 [Acidobacteriota bacterium]